jgi:hypothetical protein
VIDVVRIREQVVVREFTTLAGPLAVLMAQKELHRRPDRRLGAGRLLTVGAAEQPRSSDSARVGGPASIVLRSALGVQRHRRHTEPVG